MASRLKNILNFSVAASGNQTLPHGLNINDVGVVPDEIKATGTGSSLVFTADATGVTLTNNGTTLATVQALVEHWHTLERDFGTSGAGEGALVPQPFVSFAGSGGTNNVVAAASVNQDGTTSYARGCTISHVASSGIYTVVLATATAGCAVVVTLRDGGLLDFPMLWQFDEAASTATNKVINIYDSGGLPVDWPFTVAVVT